MPTAAATTASTTTAHQEVDWKQYALQQKYKRAGGILYKQSALTPHEYTSIRDALLQSIMDSKMMMEEEKESSFATNRIGAEISKSSEIYEVLSCEEGSLCRLVNSLADADADGDDVVKKKMVLAPDVRIYEKAGAGMEWHIDDILYRPEQIEVVLTLENNSDCWTMWRQPHHDQHLLSSISSSSSSSSSDGQHHQHQQQYDIQSTQTTPNSALIIKAGGVEHKVSPLKTGKRIILKMAFVRQGAVMEKGMESHVSHHDQKTKARKKKKKNDNRVGGENVRKKKKVARQKR
ncbi:hypothetical protein ACHAXR_011255 [Thalassiosira sp. AJA248-18]